VEPLEDASRDDIVTFRWDPVPADWTNALRACYRPYRLAAWLALPLGAFAVVLLATGQLLAGIIGLAASALAALLPPVQTRVSFHSHPGARRTMTGEANDRSVRMTLSDGTGHTELPWSELSGWARTTRGFVLRGHTSHGAVYPVPSRAFASDDDRARFQELLERHAGRAT